MARSAARTGSGRGGGCSPGFTGDPCRGVAGGKRIERSLVNNVHGDRRAVNVQCDPDRAGVNIICGRSAVNLEFGVGT